MKQFDYKINNFSTEINQLMNKIHKCQGKMELIEENYSELLEATKKPALVDESYYSTKIEGIILDYQKCAQIVSNVENNKQMTGLAGDINNFELQFEGCAKLLLTFNRRLDFFKIDTTSLLAMFYALFNIPATYKKSVYRKRDYREIVQGTEIKKVRVSPVQAYETPLYTGSAMTSLKEAYDSTPELDLINAAKFLVDLMCIMPFDAGCGRIARLFIYLLLLKADISIVKYVSLSKIFEEDAAKYYEAISLCCEGWEKNKNKYDPFIMFFLESIIQAYETLFSQTKLTGGKKLKKTERIYEYFKANPVLLTKQQILLAHPDVSISTIENALHELKTSGKIKQIGGGRSTKYIINQKFE